MTLVNAVEAAGLFAGFCFVALTVHSAYQPPRERGLFMIPTAVTRAASYTIGVAAAASLILMPTGTANADPGQRCTLPTWNTVYGIPVGSSITCFNPDGSYQTCNSIGTQGDGPGTCFNYPAPPAPSPGNLLPINPPVPGQ